MHSVTDCASRPIDVQQSEWQCTVEHEEDGSLSLRLGLRYAKRFHQNTADALVATRKLHGPFSGVRILPVRVPSLNRKDMVQLARIGAINKT